MMMVVMVMVMSVCGSPLLDGLEWDGMGFAGFSFSFFL